MQHSSHSKIITFSLACCAMITLLLCGAIYNYSQGQEITARNSLKYQIEYLQELRQIVYPTPTPTITLAPY